jgi:hypothetical protein
LMSEEKDKKAFFADFHWDCSCVWLVLMQQAWLRFSLTGFAFGQMGEAPTTLFWADACVWEMEVMSLPRKYQNHCFLWEEVGKMYKLLV